MAGFIHIKGDSGLSVGSITFNAIAEFTRSYFDENDRSYIKEIYSPLDEGGMDMVSLNDQGVEGFNAYYRGIKKAYDECIQKRKCGELGEKYFDMVMDSWKELIELLESDKRYLVENE